MTTFARRFWWRNSAWLGYAALTLLPLLAGLGYALLYSLGLVGALAEGFTLAHWTAVLGSTRFWANLGFSLFIALTSMGIALGLALWWTLRYRRLFGQGLMQAVLYVPLVFPAIVAGLVCFQLWSNGGLLARLAFQLGWIQSPQQFPGLVHHSWGLGILLTHALMAAPFFTLLFLGIWPQQKLDELLQTAATLGASQRQQVWRVALPVLLREARPTLLLYGLFVAGSYEIPLLVGAQHPQMVSVYAVTKLNRFDLGDRPEAFVIAFCFTVLVLGLLSVGLKRTLSAYTGPTFRKAGRYAPR